MFNKLRLTNFRKHRKLELAFTPGLNVIYGQNWSGKTTILYSISYALFGTRASPGLADGLITAGKTNMEVELEFELGEKTYTVCRGPSKSRLEIDGDRAPVATGQQPVTTAIEELLGVSCQDFLSFFITRQEDVFSLLSLSSGKLGQYVGRITGIDLIDRLLEKAREENAKVEGAVSVSKGNEEKIAQEKEWLQTAVPAHNRLIADAAFSRKQVEALTESYNEKVKKTNLAEQALRENEEKTRTIAIQKGILSSLESEVTRIKETMGRDERQEFQKKKTELENLEKEYSLRQDWEARGKWLTEELKKARKAMKEVKEVEKTIPEANPEEKAKIWREKSSQLQTLAEELKLAKKAHQESECPYCLRPFEGVNQEKLLENVQRFSSAHAQLLEEVEDCQKNWETDRSNKLKQDRLSELKRQWRKYADPLVKERETHSYREPKRISESVAIDLRGSVRSMEKRVTKYISTLPAYDRAKKKEREAKDRLKELSKESVPSAPARGEVEKLLQEMTALQQTLHKESIQVTNMENKVANLQTEIARRQKAVREMEESDKKLQMLKEKKENLKELIKFIRGNRHNFTVSFWNTLLEQVSQFVKEATLGDVEKLVKNASGGFSYVEGGVTLPVEGSASGMQKAIFVTGIKTSLSEALNSRLNAMFFDEVTAAASEETSLLFTSLLERIGAKKQIFLVTHRQNDAVVASNLIAL